MTLDVLLAGHVHTWEELLGLVRRAEALGYATAWVDGDLGMLSLRSEADVLDSWTLTTALLASTERIAIGSLRLVHYWNAAVLAQRAASAERLFPGRFRFFITIGDRPNDQRFGFPTLSPRERIRWLDEALDAVRALWRGETVTRHGRYVRLEGARVRPTPPGGRLPIAVAARRPRLLEVVAAHADVWDVNLPPLPGRVGPAADALAAACRGAGRDPNAVSRSMLLFVRADADLAPDAALAEYRRLNPWFRDIPDAEIRGALVLGDAAECRARIAELAHSLSLAHPVLDLVGLDAAAARRQLEALAPAKLSS